jgi:hypothetical protein
MIRESLKFRLIAFFILLTIVLLRADIAGWIASRGYSTEHMYIIPPTPGVIR